MKKKKKRTRSRLVPNLLNMQPTAKQRQVLSYCMAYVTTHGLFPSTRTIQRHFKWRSQNTTVTYLKTLVRKGKLSHKRGGYSVIFHTPGATTDAPAT